MKKILVLGALSLFGLSEVDAMVGAAVGPQAQQDTGIRVQKGSKEWKTISLEELKAGGFTSLDLKETPKERIKDALKALSGGGISMLKTQYLTTENCL